jgi:nicotinic acid mononucleotide adenylyltransferase
MREIPLRLDISATEVRRRIRKNLPITGLVPPAVETLIRSRRWYR